MSITATQRRRLHVVLMALSIGTSVTAALCLLPRWFSLQFIVNESPSAPLGLYLLHTNDGSPHRGDFVLFDPPAAFASIIYGRGWLPNGMPLIKPVGGLPGDTYCIHDNFTVNGNSIGPVFDTDSQDRPLPHLDGCYLVPTGSFLPVANYIERSFDGRYMGAVSDTLIRGNATLLVRF